MLTVHDISYLICINKISGAVQVLVYKIKGLSIFCSAPTTTPSGVLGTAGCSVWLYCRFSLVILSVLLYCWMSLVIWQLNLVIFPVESGYMALNLVVLPVESGYMAVESVYRFQQR
jgi:hypothetical protein